MSENTKTVNTPNGMNTESKGGSARIMDRMNLRP